MINTEERGFIHQGITHTTVIDKEEDVHICHGCKQALLPEDTHLFARHRENEIRYYFVHSECAIRTNDVCGDDLIQSTI